jgi:hypothetical protein
LRDRDAESFDILDAFDKDDERHMHCPALCLIDADNGLLVGGVTAQAIDGICGENQEAAAAQDCDSLLDGSALRPIRSDDEKTGFAATTHR